ncbi:MAG: tetratricopeptide repeat protein [Natronospirillum sp.]|uniref:TPR end-of-group domain-containing protein n=1 Tax=Natronospirillum sp. TaxID=2812955 RepID=UPI0025CED366|nr:tetratricopeptide repeat protein [Natronospirillum sp.]MCH8551098.1 tetratricopeptide repeat protein [Natronospirillum sp.]
MRSLTGIILSASLLLAAFGAASLVSGQGFEPGTGLELDSSLYQSPEEERALRRQVEQLDEPLYSPFIERYLMDEIRSLRMELAQTQVRMTEQLTDRQLSTMDRAMSYTTDTVTYFFYLIAAASSVLIIAGWKSLRDIRLSVRKQAKSEIGQVIQQYEQRLADLEQDLAKTSHQIEVNADEIERTNEIHALWLRASQERSIPTRISIYDQILAIRPRDAEALTYKADAVLDLNEPQWAINLCQLALGADRDYAHAYYQLACAYAMMERTEEAIQSLHQAISLNESYLEEAQSEQVLQGILPQVTESS